MSIFGKYFEHTTNRIIGEAKETAVEIVGNEQLDWKVISQSSKFDKKESIAERILINRSSNI